MRTFALLACIAATLLASVTAKAVYPCGDWVLYKQCDAAWGDHRLGTSATTTICDAGCAMSCVSMSLDKKGEKIDGKRSDPGTLNDWLTGHGGYEDSDLIVWGAVAALGKLRLESAVSSLSSASIRKAVDQCKPVIANVRDGTHWVLITGYDSEDPNNFYVNDPYFPDVAYYHSGMSHFVVYDSSRADTPAVRPTTHQLTRASHNGTAETRHLQPAAALTGKCGVDVSQLTSRDAFKCMKKYAVSYAIIRSYTELGSVDPNVVATAHNAKAAGLHVEAYHFPDTRKDAASQIKTDVEHLRKHGIKFTHLWIDVESSDWGSDKAKNVRFIRDMARAAKDMGVSVGIYTSESQWTPITGGSHELSGYPLWWATYNYEASFAGFRAFGGWHKPYMHQYKGSQDLCGAGVDVNWRP